MLITSPETTGLIVKRTSPDWPVVDVGAPWHFWIVPAIPPQICRSATLDVWKSSALQVFRIARQHIVTRVNSE